MRFYVLSPSDVSGIVPHIIAEVVREGGIDEDRLTTLASALSGARSEILTRDELLETAERRTALRAWEARDDTVHDDETEQLARPHLTIVNDRWGS
jgi:hypothetical protein